ncbi:MAG: ABC transporter substrate-binding protein [Methanocellales archaeon]
MKREIAIFILCLLLLSTTSAYAQVEKEPIKVGEINPLTGRFAKQGQALHEGILYAIEEANKKGGIDGRNITLITRDDESKPEVAIAKAEELAIKEKVVAVVGGYVDSLVGPISEVCDKNKVPYIAPASLQRELTQKNRTYFFRVSSLDAYVETMTGVVLDVFKAKKVAILYSSTPGSTQLAEEQKALLETRGVEVVVYEMGTSGASDFSPLLTKVKDKQAEVVLSDFFLGDHMIMVRQLKEQNINIKAYVGAFGVEYAEFIANLGNTSEYIYGTTVWEANITWPGTENETFSYIAGYKARFGKEPDPLSMHGYTSARALIAAIENTVKKGKELTGENIRDELREIDIITPMERVKFDSYGDPLYYPRLLFQIQNGSHAVVYPLNRATAKAIYPMPPWSAPRASGFEAALLVVALAALLVERKIRK